MKGSTGGLVDDCSFDGEGDNHSCIYIVYSNHCTSLDEGIGQLMKASSIITCYYYSNNNDKNYRVVIFLLLFLLLSIGLEIVL